MKRTGFLCLAMVAALTVGCNDGQRDTASGKPNDAVGTSGADNVSRGDRDFVNDVAIVNMAEIELGKMAAERGANAEVKKFGQMMVDDHTRAQGQLKTIIAQHSIPMPTGVDDKHNDLREKLSKLQGAEFDREYARAMVDGHEDFVDKLESRIDKERLGEWKIKRSDSPNRDNAKGEVKVEAVVAEKSDNPTTMTINEWAAKTYPDAFAHLERARKLDETVRKNATN